MPTLLLEHAPALFDEGLEHDPRRGLGGAEVGARDSRALAGLTDAHGRPRVRESRALTLDEILSSAWEGLAVRGAVTCPVCSGPMASSLNEHSRAPAPDRLSGVCLGCGSRLA